MSMIKCGRENEVRGAKDIQGLSRGRGSLRLDSHAGTSDGMVVDKSKFGVQLTSWTSY